MEWDWCKQLGQYEACEVCVRRWEGTSVAVEQTCDELRDDAVDHAMAVRFSYLGVVDSYDGLTIEGAFDLLAAKRLLLSPTFTAGNMDGPKYLGQVCDEWTCELGELGPGIVGFGLDVGWLAYRSSGAEAILGFHNRLAWLSFSDDQDTELAGSFGGYLAIRVFTPIPVEGPGRSFMFVGLLTGAGAFCNFPRDDCHAMLWSGFEWGIGRPL